MIYEFLSSWIVLCVFLTLIVFVAVRDRRTALRIAIVVCLMGGAALFTQTAKADAVSKLVAPLKPYDTAKKAAQGVLAPLLERQDGVEWGGAILRCEGGYYFATEPVTSGEAHELRHTVWAPATCKLAALYHTHPRFDEVGTLFSEGDIRDGKKQGVPNYMGSLFDKQIRVLYPSAKTFPISVNGKRSIASYGESL